MSKKDKNQGAAKVSNPVAKKNVEISDEKRAQAIKLITNIINGKEFPKVAPDVVAISKMYDFPEKSVKFFVARLEKMFSMVAKKKVKKTKNLEADLETKVKESVCTMASAIASKNFKTNSTYEKILVTKKSNKQNKNATGKAFFMLGNGKPVFMYWEYRDGNIFAGSALHEVTKDS